jgi:2-C-methyl-D-erythritol 2,4-cyclodiphosphate synthase
MNFRIGQGIDTHPFVAGRPLILGGVKIEHTHGLQGHSDADALTHAICDALLGAIAKGDIGVYFSDTASENKNRNSLEFLTQITLMVREQGWEISNIDSTIMTENPRLRPHIEQMTGVLAKTMNIHSGQVSVKATRPEKMGALGRGEGLVVHAIALLEKIKK